MDKISSDEIEAIEIMLQRYLEVFELDELNEDEESQTLYDEVSSAYAKVRPEPMTVQPDKLREITLQEKAALRNLIDLLIQTFERAGVTFTELHQFEHLCRFHKRLDPGWIAPKALRIEVNRHLEE